MINGVMHIVAAVLFAVVAFQNGVSMIWMGIAGLYLAIGVFNLAVHAIKIRKMEKTAKKAEQNNQKTPPVTTETTTGG